MTRYEQSKTPSNAYRVELSKSMSAPRHLGIVKFAPQRVIQTRSPPPHRKSSAFPRLLRNVFNPDSPLQLLDVDPVAERRPRCFAERRNEPPNPCPLNANSWFYDQSRRITLAKVIACGCAIPRQPRRPSAPKSSALSRTQSFPDQNSPPGMYVSLLVP